MLHGQPNIKIYVPLLVTLSYVYNKIYLLHVRIPCIPHREHSVLPLKETVNAKLGNKRSVL
jgi:hypothetical protein